ncbi:MAG: DUF4783 domain-containing protein [Saprospiraceae bacterium]|nr:DUF4783 domain-containing protein [Saprospiraceae bacterium]
MPFLTLTSDLDQNISAITKALSEGNVEVLSQYFDNSVEIGVMSDENMYDKAKAKQVLLSFFAKHKPTSYKIVHQGASKGNDSQYTIGSLVANGNENYRVYIYLKSEGNGKYLIQEFRLEKN